MTVNRRPNNVHSRPGTESYLVVFLFSFWGKPAAEIHIIAALSDISKRERP